eukprot:COSAG04_NODE_2716_length_3693_cov_2.258208_2_plen_87_part_00
MPLGCVYTPLKETTDLHTLPYEPVTCKKCSGILNPYARVDYRSKVWVCPICFNRNNFPGTFRERIAILSAVLSRLSRFDVVLSQTF